ncbi:hypothetical protein DL762_009393 [Monosporascus cannonballus]|uniref:pH-response regulator protein palC n=1 Tax=Monosporascus cannonballus TaxID=155416 RepID=A0ABY0GUD4_9PEZI|nr:hypothetical protein DL762_009393 [Monosporascus cannonballus]
MRDALKKHKRLPAASQPPNLPSIISSLDGYLPYLLAVDAGLGTKPLLDEDINVVLISTPAIEWRPTLSDNAIPGKETARVKVQSLEYEIFFTLSTLAYAHSLLARASLHPLYVTSGVMLGAQERTTAITTATKHLLDAASVHDYLARRAENLSTTPPCIDIAPSTTRALALLALAEATLLAVLKDDPYPAVVAQDRNKNDREWMYRAPEIPKVRAHLFARLCLAAADHAAQASSLCQSPERGLSRLNESLLRYLEDLRKACRAKACRFFGIDAELSGQTGNALGWLRCGLQELGIELQETKKGLSLSRLKKDWSGRREDKKVEKGTGWGADAGKGEETRVIEMLEAKWSKENDTVSNYELSRCITAVAHTAVAYTAVAYTTVAYTTKMLTQTVPPPATLLSSLPSGREIHSIKSYQLPELSRQSLEAMRAPPDRSDDFGEGSLSSDDDQKTAVDVPIGAFPGTQADYRSDNGPRSEGLPSDNGSGLRHKKCPMPTTGSIPYPAVPYLGPSHRLYHGSEVCLGTAYLEMSQGAQLDVVAAAKANAPTLENVIAGEKNIDVASSSSNADDVLIGPNGEQYPTKEELETLPRVVGKVHWVIYTIAFIELCERFGYYGTTAVFVNFIQFPLPEGSATGAAGTYGQPGALGFGQQASTALVLFNSFWSYLMPILGGYLADAYWGRYHTINVAIVIATVGHIIIIISSIPGVVTNPSGALGCFIVGLIFFGMGVGFFKCNISPMIAEQYEHENPRATVEINKKGQKVINDPVLTISHIYMRYYFFINVGALVGQISMVYAEKYVGFWLAYTLPTVLFLLCPLLMIWLRNKYHRRPPTGSVLSKSMATFFLALKGRVSLNPVQTWRNCKDGEFWERVKPSRLENKPSWMTFDDAWVDEVRRGFQACKVFAFYPIFWLAYGQMTNNLVSQAATMKLGAVPNDIVHNLNPFALLILIPICDKFVYPALEKAGLKFTPIKKITGGFAAGTVSMVVAAVIQHSIYKQSLCGKFASDCDTPPDIWVWVQAPAYILIALSEIFASITGLEYAFTKAPKNMRSLITGVFWFAQAFSSAIAQAFVSLATDPLLEWLYTAITIISALGGIGFWITFKSLDAQEEALNALPESTFKGSRNQEVDEEAVLAEQRRQDKIREAQGLK